MPDIKPMKTRVSSSCIDHLMIIQSGIAKVYKEVCKEAEINFPDARADFNLSLTATANAAEELAKIIQKSSRS